MYTVNWQYSTKYLLILAHSSMYRSVVSSLVHTVLGYAPQYVVLDRLHPIMAHWRPLSPSSPTHKVSKPVYLVYIHTYLCILFCTYLQSFRRFRHFGLRRPSRSMCLRGATPRSTSSCHRRARTSALLTGGLPCYTLLVRLSGNILVRFFVHMYCCMYQSCMWNGVIKRLPNAVVVVLYFVGRARPFAKMRPSC